jgi:hypothetical protein
MEKLKTLPILNPCIPRILPCNNCITLGICRSFLNSAPELIDNFKEHRGGWTDGDIRYLIYNELILLTQRCSCLHYYLQPPEVYYAPVDGWRLTNVYSVLSYLNIKLFVEYQKTIIREEQLRLLVKKVRNRITF